MVALFIALQVWAAEPTELLKPFPSEVLRHETVEFMPTLGHHFSQEAPQRCGSGVLLAHTPRVVRCQFPQVGESSNLLNVCDDKQTYCKPIAFKLQVKETSQTPAFKNLIENEVLNRDLKRTLVPGFVELSLQEASKEARTRGQPVFVMISTEWCPSCNEAKEYLLSSLSFQKAAQNWFKVYVDGDSLAAAEWEKKVPYRFYPSFVLLDSRMDGVARYVGELRQGDFETWAKNTNVWVTEPIPSLREKVLARRAGSVTQKLKDLWNGVGREAQLKQEQRLLDWALALEDRDLLQRLSPIVADRFPELEPFVLSYQLDELERAEREQGVDQQPAKIENLKKQLALALKGEHWASVLQSLCALNLETCKPYLAQIPERLQFLQTQTGLLEPEKESQLGDEYYSITEVYQAVGDKKLEKEFAEKCADHYEALKRRSFLKISRAGQQGMIACLELSGQFEKERAVIKNLLTAYPNESTFPWRMARSYRKEKKSEQALPWINKAEALAYGYNWFNIELLKADLLLDLKRAPEAKKVVDEALAQVRLEPTTSARNQSLVARLRTAQEKASAVVQK